MLVGSPVSTDLLAKRIANESTVAPADVLAVLKALSGVMGDYMAGPFGETQRHRLVLFYAFGIGPLGFAACLSKNMTAPRQVRNDIDLSLGLYTPEIFITGFDRPNQFFEVRYTGENKYSHVKRIVAAHFYAVCAG